MAAMVTKLELINGEGKILTLTPQDNKDLFNAAQVHACMLLVDVFRVMGGKGRGREVRAEKNKKREKQRERGRQ